MRWQSGLLESSFQHAGGVGAHKRVVTGERRRITQLLDEALTPTMEKQLARLLEADNGMYRISVLKHEPKDFSYKQMQQEVARRKFFQPLYEFAHTFLVTTGISNESVKYYASLVQFYTVYKLQRIAVATTRLYLLCFAYHRFRQINDNLIEAFIHLIDQYIVVAGLRTKARCRRPNGNGHHQGRQFVRNYRI